VIQACREQALAAHEPYVIWGGLSEDDRVAIINRGKPAVASSFGEFSTAS
jgi:WhiB family redox-sensing transcriptional regulator